MDLKSYDLYQLDSKREKVLWNDCVFVFDSSALLDFYSFPKTARDQIYGDILKPHRGRFWISSHVQYEFLKNREKVIVKPINELYEPLRSENLKKINDSIKQIENQTLNIQNSIKDQGTHPHFSAIELEEFKVKIDEFNSHVESMCKAVNAHIDNAINEIKELSANDDVTAAFESLLIVGRDYTFNEIYEITKEGAHRFSYFIPPGYKDLGDSEKKGTQIFGDLIIWKQLLEYGKEIKKPIIFICDDLKEDWCYVDKRTGGEKRILKPREELIKEMYDNTGLSFWMYNLPQFLHLANEYWDTAINESDIKNVADAIATRTPCPPKLEMDLIYQGGGRSPRGYSDKNPVETENGRTFINIGAGIKPIIHWYLDWRFELRINNNSSFPAFNLKIESVGQAHFSFLEELRPVNNIKPLGNIAINASFNQMLESVHSEADELMRQRIPQVLEGLLLRVICLDENENKYVFHMKIENGDIINF